MLNLIYDFFFSTFSPDTTADFSDFVMEEVDDDFF